jgi:hypothetical protein
LDYPIFFANATASRDGRWLAFGRGNTVFLCKATTGQNWKLKDPHLANVNRLAFSHDSQVLAASDGAQIHLFSAAARKYLRSIQRPGAKLQDFAFSPTAAIC